jgi:2-polyprenyl-3-methyl-5-hydroxy-6-metoxy-1,4-benzoquinol methylase
MNCALCNGTHFSLISQKDCKSGKELNIYLCDDCGLIQQLPLPSPEELRHYYATEYRLDYKKTYHPKPKHIHRSAGLALSRAKFLRANGITSGSLLDIGAGSGEFVTICSRSGLKAEGAEPNVGYSEFARSEYGANIRTQELANLEGRYDTITMFHVMEHLPSPQQVFEKLYDLLNPGGRLLIEVPWGLSPSISPSNRYFKAHLYYFDAETLAACASSHFDVIAKVQEGNLMILFEKKNHLSGIRLPSPDYAKNAKIRALRCGWWSYLTIGKGFRVPFRKLRKIYTENRMKRLSGSSILDRLMKEAA